MVAIDETLVSLHAMAHVALIDEERSHEAGAWNDRTSRVFLRTVLAAIKKLAVAQMKAERV